MDQGRLGHHRQGAPARTYELTATGRKQLDAEESRWRAVRQRLSGTCSARVIGEGGHDVLAVTSCKRLSQRSSERRARRGARFHVDATVDQLVAEGVSPARPRRSKRRRRRKYRTAVLRERSRDVKLLPWLDALVRDVRLGTALCGATRWCRPRPSSRWLAIGACTAAFALIDALILRELPVATPIGSFISRMPPKWRGRRTRRSATRCSSGSGRGGQP